MREIGESQFELGRIIYDCMKDIVSWQNGGNTLLGTIILFVPIAVAAGMSLTKEDLVFDVLELRRNIKLVVERTTTEDGLRLYDAIEVADPGGLNKVPSFDVRDPQSKEQILSKKVTLYQIFKIASNYDNICSEWVNNYPITFTVAYPYFMEQIRLNIDLNTAITQTFLKVLSQHPDSLVSRKVGLEKSKKISLKAQKILQLGGLSTKLGRTHFQDFDRDLRKRNNLLNPGTTADIVGASLALATLSGYRP